LLARPPVLVLVDPTSALDSYTEADIVERLPAARAGSCTIVFTSSPALLAAADEILYFERGAVVARGTHAELLDSTPAYRGLVIWDDSVSIEDSA
jgi:ABC-type multidrug transport system fused ATPase/permease subunit